MATPVDDMAVVAAPVDGVETVAEEVTEESKSIQLADDSTEEAVEDYSAEISEEQEIADETEISEESEIIEESEISDETEELLEENVTEQIAEDMALSGGVTLIPEKDVKTYPVSNKIVPDSGQDFYPTFWRFLLPKDDCTYTVSEIIVDGKTLDTTEYNSNDIFIGQLYNPYGMGTDNDYQAMSFYVGFYGTYSGSKVVKVGISRTGSDGIEKKYMLSKSIEFRNDPISENYGPVIIDGTTDLCFNTCNGKKGFNICSDSIVTGIRFINNKKTVVVDFTAEEYVNNNAYSPEYSESLVLESPNGYRSGDRMYMVGQYPVRFYAIDDSKIPNGSYAVELTTEDGKVVFDEDRRITITGSAASYQDFDSLYAKCVPTAYKDANGSGRFKIYIYNPALTSSTNVSKFNASLKIDGVLADVCQTTPVSGFMEFYADISKCSVGEHNYELTIDDMDEIVGYAKTSGIFTIANRETSEITEYTFEQASIKESGEGIYKDFTIPLDTETDKIEKVEAVNVSDSNKKTLLNIEDTYFYNNPIFEGNLSVTYEGQDISVPTNAMSCEIWASETYLSVSATSLDPGDYNFLITKKSGKTFSCKNALKVVGGIAVTGFMQVNPDDPYYANPYSRYVSLYVYCEKDTTKLLENAPVLYFDKNLNEVAAKTDSKKIKSPIVDNTVVYQLRMGNKLAGMDSATLYAYFEDSEGDSNGTLITNYNAFVNDNGKIVVPVEYSVSPVTKISISTGTNKAYKIYISAAYEEELVAENYLVNISANVYNGYNNTGIVSTSLLAYQNSEATCSDDYYVVDVPTNSDFYKQICTGYSHQINITIGDKTFTTYGIKTNIEKLTNLSVSKGTWTLFNTYDPSFELNAGLSSGTAGTNIFTASQLAYLSKYPELTLSITEPTYITDTKSPYYKQTIDVTKVKKVQFISPLKDSISYDLGGVVANNNNKNTIYKNEEITLNAPVAASSQYYTFEGWFLDSKYTKPVEKLTGIGGKEVCVYAKWDVAKINVGFGNFAKYVAWDEPFAVNMDDIAPVGYYINKYWFDISLEYGNEIRSELYSTNINVKISDLYNGGSKVICVDCACETTPIDYDIHYNLNGVALDSSDTYEPAGKTTYTIETNNMELPSPAEENWPKGMYFAGWYKDYALTEKIDKITLGMYGDLEIYAKWELAPYTIVFNANEPANTTVAKTMEPINAKVAGVYSLPANVYAPVSTESKTRKYAFIGWSTDKNLKDDSIIYADKSKVCFLGDDLTYEDGQASITLYAQYYIVNETEFNINYEINTPLNIQLPPSSWYIEEDGFPQNTTYKYGTTTKLPTSLPNVVMPGYEFGGWKNAETGKTITQITAKDSGDITVNAIWKPKNYKIAFNVNGGSSKIATKNVTFTEFYSLDELNNIKKNGYEIDYVEATLGNTAIDTIYSTGDIAQGILSCFGEELPTIIKAKSGTTITYKIYWKPATFKLTYDANGGTVKVGDEVTTKTTYGYSDKVQEIATPTREGYTFLGWYAEPEFKTLLGKYNAKDGKTRLNAKTYGNRTLYAKWEANYTLILHSADKKKTKEVSGYKLGVSKALPANPFGASKDYFFGGWALESNYDAYIKYADKDNINLTEEDVKLSNGRFIINLYAKEMLKKIGTFDGAGNQVGTIDNTKYDIYFMPTIGNVSSWYLGISGSMKKQTATSGKITKLTPNKFKSQSRVFVGWTTDCNGTEPMYADGDLINNTVGAAYSSPSTSTIYLYGIWKDKFDITFNVNAADAVAGARTTYTYVYGSVVDEKTFKQISSPTRPGYDFAGWCTDTAGKKPFKSITKKTSGDITLYAKWTPKKITVRYLGDLDSATGKMKDQTILYGNSYKLSKCTYKVNGASFVSWSVNGATIEAGKVYNPTLTDAENGFINVYANWSYTEYCLTYKNMDYMYDGYTPGQDYIVKFYSISGCDLVPFSRAGYAFEGFYADASFKKPVTEIPRGTAKNVTVYVKWKLLDEKTE